MCAAAWVGAGVAAAGLLGGMFGNKGGGDDSGEKALARLQQELFTETDPIRKVAINRAMQAMLSGKADDTITQAKRSSIQGNQAQVRGSTERRLARAGLLNSSYGISKLEDVDRATSQMLVGADVSELERLNIYGEGAAFGSIPAQVSAAGTLAQIQGQESIAASARSSQQGQASGQLLGLLLSRYMTSQGSAGVNTRNMGANSTADLEALFN